MNKGDSKEKCADDQYGQRANDGVKLTTPFGTVQAHGPMVIAVVLVVCAVGVLAFMVRDHDAHTRDTLRAERDARIALQARIDQKMDNLLWATLLPESRKGTVLLDMPPDLRNQLLNQERRQ